MNIVSYGPNSQKICITLAIFILFGIIPVSKDLLKIIMSGVHMDILLFL